MDLIDICNLSLGMLGDVRIHAIDENDEVAAAYPFIRDCLLRDHIWSFATEFATLAVLIETSPDSRFEYVCQLPSDCLRVIGINSDTEKYIIIGRKILVNYTPAIVTYCKRETDATRYDSLFIDCLSYGLAARLALAMTHDAKLAGYLEEQFERKKMIAKGVNAQENTHAYQSKPYQSAFLASRLSGNSSAMDKPLTYQ